MHPDHWHVTDEVESFLARAGDFLRSRPALHTLHLTVTEALRTRGPHAYGSGTPVLGILERAGEVRATFFRTPPRHLSLTPLTPAECDTLASRLAALGDPLPGVSGDRDTAASFAEAWQRHTGATPALQERQRLYRLGTLTVPEPRPEGRSRVAGVRDREQLIRWHDEFMTAIGSGHSAGAESWADAHIAEGRITFWEAPDGTPVSMAGVSPVIAGQARVAPVYTPAHLRGRGYAGAATVEAGRAAVAAGATEVLLFTDLANPTSNGLYQRIGYRPVTDFAMYAFGQASPSS